MKQKPETNKLYSGLGLVETLIAVAISVIVIVSLVSLSTYTLRSSQESEDLQKGSSMAQSQIEQLRAYRDSHSWSSLNGFYDRIDSCTQASPCKITNGVIGAAGVPGTLSPNVHYPAFWTTTTTNGTLSTYPTIINTVRIHVKVVWLGGETYNFTDLSNWRSN